MNVPQVNFAVRYPAGDGKWRYQTLVIAHPGGGPFYPMAYPPAVGDVIFLWDTGRGALQPEGGPNFLVVARRWSSTDYGSADWPYGKPEPATGPLVDIIVEPSEGVYRDETDICSESTCEAVWMNGAWWTPRGADVPDPHEHQPYERDAGTVAP